VRWLANGESTLHILTHREKVGEGLVVQHGHSTRIGAYSIGSDCQIWQNVTIGVNHAYLGKGIASPIIGNNVKIMTSAVIFGQITIGDNVVIGAGSVVFKNIPANATVVGNPAHIVKLNGEKVDMKL
jgi:serine O-acetyltransferase